MGPDDGARPATGGTPPIGWWWPRVLLPLLPLSVLALVLVPLVLVLVLALVLVLVLPVPLPVVMLVVMVAAGLQDAPTTPLPCTRRGAGVRTSCCLLFSFSSWTAPWCVRPVKRGSIPLFRQQCVQYFRRVAPRPTTTHAPPRSMTAACPTKSARAREECGVMRCVCSAGAAVRRGAE